MGEENDKKGNQKQDNDKEEKDGEITENSSSMYKGSSELSTNQQDSAYSSIINSAYSSLDSLRTPTTNSCASLSQSTNSRSSTKILSSKSSGSSGRSTQLGAVTSTTQGNCKDLVKPSTKETPDRPLRKKKPKISHSNDESRQFTTEKGNSSGFNTAQECKAAKVATLSQALGYVDQFRRIQASKSDKARRGHDESDLNDLAINLKVASQTASTPTIIGMLPEAPDERVKIPEDTIIKHEKTEGSGFCVAVSLHDGMVMQTTVSITSILGYPKDMWVGRSFIDFVHPQDKDTFINQVTENIGLILRDFHPTQGTRKTKKDTYCKSGGFFCRIRIYNGLKSGFSVKERKTRYSPFKLSVCFLEMDSKDSSRTPGSGSIDGGPQSTYLFITAIPLVSAFTESYQEFPANERNSEQHVFVTKHNSSCVFSNIEESTIPYLGYLPQDMNGEDIFNFIHPHDLGQLKNVFETAMLEQGKPCKSKDIRFKVRNGGYIQCNSWWSCFINPWSRQLEFVHGKHVVTKGPRHPDVFADFLKDSAETVQLTEEHTKQTANINNEIKHILRKTVQRNTFLDSNTENSSKTKKELSSFMGTLLEEVSKAETIKLSRTGKIGAVVIGNISPHQSDSSETPPSYNQLTYNENLTRFFNSQPKTLSEKDNQDVSSQHQSKSSEDTLQESNHLKKKGQKPCSQRSVHKEDGGRSALGSGGSGEQTQTISGSGEGNGNHSSTLQTGLSAGQVQSGREECMMSQDGSGSGSRFGSGSRGASVDAYNPPALTVELLAMHNKDMEQKMLSKFKEAKKTGDIRFIRDSKYGPSQNNVVKRLSLQKGNPSVLKNETQIKSKKHQSKPAKEPKSGPAYDLQPNCLPGTDLQWNHFQEEVGARNKFSNAKVNHGHEGYVGFNQANMMERGTPNTLPGFRNVIGVPAFYMAINGRLNSQPAQTFDSVQSGILLQNTPTRYIPMGVIESVPGGVYHQLGISGVDPRVPGSKRVVGGHHSPSQQPELPNCLAVNSCMVCHPASDRSSCKVLKHETKFARPLSRTGSRATSVKGEPGSALESNASATASVKEKNILSPKGHTKPAKKGYSNENDIDPNCLSTSSSSLYSFLKTSEDYSCTNPNSSGDEVIQLNKHIAKPVLSEPFWNERIELTTDLIFNYQLEPRDKATVLKEDLEKLRNMQQFPELHEQLMELFLETEETMSHAQLLLEVNSNSSYEESTSAEEGAGEYDEIAYKKKRLKRKEKLEKLNIFMEADAPFPMPDSPKLALSSKGSWKMFSSPNYSSNADHNSEFSISSNSEVDCIKNVCNKGQESVQENTKVLAKGKEEDEQKADQETGTPGDQEAGKPEEEDTNQSKQKEEQEGRDHDDKDVSMESVQDPAAGCVQGPQLLNNESSSQPVSQGMENDNSGDSDL